MLFRALLVSSVVLSGCAVEVCEDVSDSDDEAVGPAEQAIVGGTVDEVNRSTVALLLRNADGSRGLCSGTVIARRGELGYVLTAAHCVGGSVEAIYEATDFRDCEGGDASKCLASYQPVAWQAHPSYGTVSGKDFAVVTFQGATDATTVTPAASSDALAVGDMIELSGYGRTYAGPTNASAAFNSKRYHLSLPLTSATSTTLRFDAVSGKSACFGDSGGPAFGSVAGERRVVGVTANGDENCAVISNYGRVSSVFDSFILPIIGPEPQTEPEPGTSSSNTSSSTSTTTSGAGGADCGTSSGTTSPGSTDGGGGAGGDSADADDPVQECRIEAAGCSASPASDASNASWLVALSIALGLGARRRRARR